MHHGAHGAMPVGAPDAHRAVARALGNTSAAVLDKYLVPQEVRLPVDANCRLLAVVAAFKCHRRESSIVGPFCASAGFWSCGGCRAYTLQE